MEKTKKPIYKRIWFWIIVAIVVIVIATSQGDDKTQSTSAKANNVPELKIGETWTVDGQWNLTINSVEVTNKRNQFSEKDPKQVVYVTYSYENLGYEDNSGIMEGLYFDLGAGLNTTVIDGNGEVGYSYPNDIITYPQQTPVGAKCVNAQACIGLNNESDIITMNISQYDGNGKQQKATYKLDIK